MLRHTIAPDLLELLESASPGDIDLYSQYARAGGGPVLALLCGTGRIAIAIAKQGLPVIGLETDAAIVEHAKRKAQQAGASRVMFVRSEPTNFVSESKHSLVIISGGALARLLTLEDQGACLMAARQALQLGGKLVIDTELLDPGAPTVEPPLIRRQGAPGDKVAVIHRTRRFDPARQLVEELIGCDWLGESGDVERTQYASLSTRFSTPSEIQLLLHGCGFKAELYGGFDRQALLPGAKRLVVEAQRA